LQGASSGEEAVSELNRTDPSADAARLLALELFREDKVSLGRAAELCKTPVEAFISTAELEADRTTLKRFQR